MAKLKIALVLGGGAARGLAHLGILDVFDKAGIKFDMIVGTSMGALIGAMYIMDGKASKVLPKVKDYLNSDEFSESKIHALRRSEEEDLGFFDQFSKYMKRAQVMSSTVTRRSYFDQEEVREFFSHFVDDRDIRSLDIPLYIMATDILTGEQVVIDSGPVLNAVAASSAIPGAFPPVQIGERLLVDGGMVNMVPATIALQKGADFIIAVNVSHELPKPSELKRALRIYFRAHEITKQVLIKHQLKFADVVLTPKVGDTHWADFTKGRELIDAGAEVAKEKLPAIFALLKKLKRKPRFLRKKKVKKQEMVP